jgi:branched-chain amino acid transport system substrate-binding protein
LVDHVVAFITYGSSITPAQAPIFKQGNVIALNAFSMTPSIEEVSTDTGLMFTTLNPSSVEVAALAEAAYDKGLRRMATLVWNNDRGLGGAKVFKDEFTKLGGEIIGEVTSEPTATDYRPELTKLKGFGADGVFLSSAAKTTGGQLAQAAQLGIETTWVCDNSCTGSEFLDLAGDAAVGVITSRQFDGVNGTPEMVALEEKIQAKYGEPAQYFHATTYDAVNVFAQAATAVLEAGDELTPENLVAALHAIKGYKGATGDITFDEIGLLDPQPVKVFTIAAEGELEPLG